MTWTTVRVADLATVSSGGGAPQDVDAFSAQGIPFVRAGSLVKLLGGQPEDSLELLQPDVASAHKLKLFPEGTVLFAKSGMSATMPCCLLCVSATEIIVLPRSDRA